MEQNCTVSECTAKQHGRGFCIIHYHRWRAHGDPMVTKQNKKRGERVIDLNVLRQASFNCILWPYGKNSVGYGRLSWNGKVVTAPRLALEFKLGRALREGYECCHTCDVRLCVNQNHLYEGTRSDNVRDAWIRTRKDRTA